MTIHDPKVNDVQLENVQSYSRDVRLGCVPGADIDGNLTTWGTVTAGELVDEIRRLRALCSVQSVRAVTYQLGMKAAVDAFLETCESDDDKKLKDVDGALVVPDDKARLIVRSYDIRTLRTFPSPDDIAQVECMLVGTAMQAMADAIARACNDRTPVSVIPGTWRRYHQRRKG